MPDVVPQARDEQAEVINRLLNERIPLIEYGEKVLHQHLGAFSSRGVAACLPRLDYGIIEESTLSHRSWLGDPLAGETAPIAMLTVLGKTVDCDRRWPSHALVPVLSDRTELPDERRGGRRERALQSRQRAR
jgi:hypothetical protein